MRNRQRITCKGCGGSQIRCVANRFFSTKSHHKSSDTIPDEFHWRGKFWRRTTSIPLTPPVLASWRRGVLFIRDLSGRLLNLSNPECWPVRVGDTRHRVDLADHTSSDLSTPLLILLCAVVTRISLFFPLQLPLGNEHILLLPPSS